MNKTLMIAGILLAGLLAGCNSNPTNAPSDAEIAQANKDRAAAIDNDTTMTPEDKAKMKERMGLNSPSGSEAAAGKGR